MYFGSTSQRKVMEKNDEKRKKRKRKK